ncbi:MULTISPECIES: hypothetical protein [unclassified Paracoccus (in: a-proteobacteria)]|uniref:hypothetical protein n=1 Tax=unclassified Paracoccus (in: a-proteobacteria) TaxID=2688777 RepID=UPI0018A6ACAB|nr:MULTISPECIES: hypothetical protein [unclassified Paracoccus (in: a-proteobacteria)]UXU76546.1 hypothetical protein GB879_014320 [Paracoccus sp. SMMA_5]UXU82387.1 hypothetical protein GB880_014115 [Paracoccus sp. SMMA_5_TC]
MKGTVTLISRRGALVSGEYEVVGDMIRVFYGGHQRAARLDGGSVDHLAQALLRDLWLG